MASITTDQYAPRRERLSLRLIMPRHLLALPMVLIGGFGTVIIAVVVLLHNNSLPRNPFVDYADVLPGQAIPALDARGFTCPLRDYNYYHDPSETRCHLNTATGAFTRIEVVYSSGLIHETNFDLREGTLNLGELAGVLGISELHTGDSVIFVWRDKVGVARIGNSAAYTPLFRTVRQVTLTDIPMFRP